ncbi:AtpZ/AtpI family protein [Sphingomonas sp. SUN019]|uniref:AtpZ/AtpI family protein n=1 Tax=Sphingomonas sp. SUN019 TaxID=2937788 RepID=UPI0021641B29|nr:AtpZ/AtpI family protein [Sphingomonas sp. SUN019]UVO51708.1 AtpZ/AtpI family protein [Sphingomonas sp. SUN019]
MAEIEPGPDTLGEDARLRSLDERLKAAQNDEVNRTGAGKTGSDAGYRLGNRVLAELLGGMVGGALIGWTFDWFAGTSPWGLLVMLFLGIIVAFRNIIRISQPPK